MKFWRAVLPLAILFLSPCFTAAGTSLTSDDVAAIKRVHQRYEEAWLRGDADGVRSLFTEDSVLMPPHGDQPRVGRKQLDEFWFAPNLPPTTVTKLTLSIENIGGDAQLAYVWGHFEVGWKTVQDGKTITSSNKGTFLNVLKKQPDGEWKISHHMWDNPEAQH